LGAVPLMKSHIFRFCFPTLFYDVVKLLTHEGSERMSLFIHSVNIFKFPLIIMYYPL
jgi:hypothetical protein